MQLSHRPLRLLIGLVGLSLGLLLAGLAQTDAPAPLPPAAQEAVNKGIIAAKVPDYLLAIRYFQDARKLAPDAPEVFYNLGLAESKIPGRELRAIAWFGAYLAANPTASNAAAVKEQMNVLVVTNQSNTSRFLKTVQDAARQISGGNSEDLRHVAELWAKAGDIPAALTTAGLIRSHLDKNWAYVYVAIAQAEAGDIAGALKTADPIKDGDGLKDGPSRKSFAQSHIAEAQIKAGDSAGAKETLASALRTAALIEDASDKGNAQLAIAKAQVEAGDITGAQNTANLIRDVDHKSAARVEIAYAQERAGDIAGALWTADLIHGGWVKSSVQTTIAEAQIKAGDIAGAKETLASAQKTAALIEDGINKRNVLKDIAEAQAKAGGATAPTSTRQSTSDSDPQIQPVVTVSDWRKKLDGGDTFDECRLNSEPFLDLVGYLKSLPPSDEPEKVFESLYETAKKIVGAQNVITGMLKQQAGK